MSEKRKRVLKMLQEGKITADEADQLLEALGKREQGAEEKVPAPLLGRMFRVRVYENGKEKPKVKVNIPLKLARAVRNLIPKEKLAHIESKGIDLDALDELVKGADHFPLRLVDVEDGDDKVEVYIE